ncbi:hypothetical protein H8S23_06905 [Anaerofilum sp. BX8]|uniref:Uncharacterized protein n=1 Tax=Anaerofilum hominis TaxID=2763016 RepID=A0A923IAF9_9FIRM|nr:hypothetical protein [Anaerofilum hominis]MBC5581233.1 hypothetical protein [Anaerofilum hominis]
MGKKSPAPARGWQAHAAPLAFLLAFFWLGVVLYHTLAGGTLLAANPYDSYSLQAQNWLAGSLSIRHGEAYPWLELAVFQGRYYLSFPPVPTLFALPWAALGGGAAAPANLLVAGYAAAGLAAVYACFARLGHPPQACAFWASFFVLATNLLGLCCSGGVWYQAQVLNFMLCALGAWQFAAGHRGRCLFLLALAVGCRPFSALYLPLALLLFRLQDRREGRAAGWTLKSALAGLAAAALVAAGLMALNVLRFGDPFEFGHAYLPEFQRSERGQFSLSYLPGNLLALLRPVTLTADLALDFPRFDGFLFFLSNPVFLAWSARLVRGWREKEDGRIAGLLTGGAFLLGLLLLCAHRTTGGWQFGARYTVDLLPAALLYFCAVPQAPPRRWERACCLLGVLFNAFGAVYMLIGMPG